MKVALVSGLFFALVSCGGARTDTAPASSAVPEKKIAEPTEEAEPLPAIPSSPAPAPDSLVATTGVASASAVLAEAGRYLEAVSPGLGASADSSLIDAAARELTGLELAGIDYGKPMWALILDPQGLSSASPVVVVAAVTDRAAFDGAARAQDMVTIHDGGFAAVGARDAMTIAAPFALSALARQSAPAKPTATIFVAGAMERYRAQLHAGVQLMSQQLEASGDPQAATTTQMMKGMLALIEQIEVAHVSLDFAGAASLVIELVAKQESAAAGLFARQPAARFDFLGTYAGSAILFGGRLDWSSLGEVLGPYMTSANQVFGQAEPAMREFYEASYRLLRGEMAIGASIEKGRFSLAGHWGVSDPEAAKRLLTEAFGKLAAARKSGDGAFYEISARPRAFRHRRATVASMTMKMTKNAPPEQRDANAKIWGKGPIDTFFSVVGTSYLMTMGQGSKKGMKAAIDRATAGEAREASTPALTKAVATARGRSESFLSLVDLASVMATVRGTAATPTAGEPLAIGLGFAGGRLSLRIALPVDQAKAFAMQGSP